MVIILQPNDGCLLSKFLTHFWRDFSSNIPKMFTKIVAKLTECTRYF